MPYSQPRRASRPLDAAALDALALRYVGRYATTQARLASYLARKIAERGVAEGAALDIAAVVARCAAARYVDDAAFAEARAGTLVRRGYGARRVHQSLTQAGVARAVTEAVLPDDEAGFAACEAFARRKRIGRFGSGDADPARQRRELAAMLRAGHKFADARHFLDRPVDSEAYDDFPG